MAENGGGQPPFLMPEQRRRTLTFDLMRQLNQSFFTLQSLLRILTRIRGKHG